VRNSAALAKGFIGFLVEFLEFSAMTKITS
jgi:hypothetical protein